MTTQTIVVRILDREFRLSCPHGAEHELRDAALYLDQAVHKIRDSGKVIGFDRLTVMAALNITHELLTLSQAHAELTEELHELSAYPNDYIEEAI